MEFKTSHSGAGPSAAAGTQEHEGLVRLEPGETPWSVKEKLEDDVLAAISRPGRLYWFGLAAAVVCVIVGLGACWGYQILRGMGASGLRSPVGWGVYITDFVFWVGIAHSGTLISAVLYLFRARFRSRFNRAAEAMTIFAVMTAGLFPLIHLGRPWFFYWLLPYPNQRMLWVNFRSPLLWDVFAVSTYFTISAVFWYLGLVPDLAICRRKFAGLPKLLYSIFSLGWTGSHRQWKHYNRAYAFLAAFATPLVVSVHSVVSWDFAMSIVPGWHTTIFAPYFVAGAIFSGTAMVLTLMIPMRSMFRLERWVTPRHFDLLTRVMIVTGMIVTYSYITEIALAAYAGEVNKFEWGQFLWRMTGDYAPAFWLMMFCNGVVPLTLFVKKLRYNLVYLWICTIFVNIGMWLERFNIIIQSLSKEYNPYSWGNYYPSLIEIGITIGSFGWFFMWFLLFAKTLPVLAITEIKEEADETAHL
ncbi:MAG: polysulfide reductase NrfD [Candidatus Sumerlaeia bacterium]